MKQSLLFTTMLLTLAIFFWAGIHQVFGGCGCPGHPNSYSGIPQPDADGIIEGDVQLSPVQIAMATNPRFRGQIFKTPRTWPGGVIPYKLTDWRHKIIAWNIKSALNKLSEKTGGCVRFRKATSRDTDYVRVVYGSRCHSQIGRLGGAQEVSLGFGCELHPTIQHIFMHTLGLYHEHVRQDRDKFIDVRWKNVETSECHNFAKYAPPIPLRYDLASIMQLGSFAFSCKLGKSTMWDKHGGKVGGDLGGIFYPNSLTDLDKEKIKYLYKC